MPITELRVTVPKALDICDDVLPSNHMRVNVPIISSVQIKGVLHFVKPEAVTTTAICRQRRNDGFYPVTIRWIESGTERAFRLNPIPDSSHG